ncbi:hypothetical protein CSUI_002114 [Cystoisospora suis]|uniref:Uncharacterized protein n=1 Tax=Cystoisospora suis TaxID=483139 RepID=A0A2C6LA90_9APIC|nr:hypothetical protein CSUI_002114 [Cystoisospora suis]
MCRYAPICMNSVHADILYSIHYTEARIRICVCMCRVDGLFLYRLRGTDKEQLREEEEKEGGRTFYRWERREEKKRISCFFRIFLLFLLFKFVEVS